MSLNESTKALVAIGAAIAANCEPCFRHHFDAARKAGASREDMLEAVNTALAVKATPHKKVVETAQKYLASEEGEAPMASNPCACGSDGGPGGGPRDCC